MRLSLCGMYAAATKQNVVFHIRIYSRCSPPLRSNTFTKVIPFSIVLHPRENGFYAVGVASLFEQKGDRLYIIGQVVAASRT